MLPSTSSRCVEVQARPCGRRQPGPFHVAASLITEAAVGRAAASVQLDASTTATQSQELLTSLPASGTARITEDAAAPAPTPAASLLDAAAAASAPAATASASPASHRGNDLDTCAGVLDADVQEILAAMSAGDDDGEGSSFSAEYEAWLAEMREQAAAERQRLEALALDPEVVAEARRWPAHRAAYHDDDERLRELSASWEGEEWLRLDCCGNTLVHVAALRGSHRCLRLALQSGYPPDTKNSAGWTAMEECLSRQDRVTARVIWDYSSGRREEARARGRQVRRRTLETLRSMPDFTMRIRWRFGSPIFGMLLKARGGHT